MCNVGVIVASGFTLKYDRATDDKKGSVTINLPEQYAGKTEGICGNSNGNKADDEFAKGGNKKVSDAEVGDSWKIPNADKRPAWVNKMAIMFQMAF